MNLIERSKKVALLKAGQIVEIDGLMFSARRINDNDLPTPCLDCNVDCLCHGDILAVCTELDFLSKSVWYLYLESEKSRA